MTRQSSLSSHTGCEVVEYVRDGEDLTAAVTCPDCGADVSASKGSHPLPDAVPAERTFGWACTECENTFPSNATGADAPMFNDRMTAIRATFRDGHERWIPVPKAALPD